jgi:hypothetical protein
MKTLELLQVVDFVKNPVWEFFNDDSIGETTVHPVEQLPVGNLNNKIVGTQVELANRVHVWAMISNVDTRNPRSTEHFLTISIERNRQWFNLARYHDVNYAEKGPEALAQFLHLPIGEVFPIAYDITQCATGDPAALTGKILKEPRERLSQAQLITMATA